MVLVTAQKLAEEVMVEIRPFCASLEVAGSIRRKRPFPRDIDIVCVPGNQGQLALKLKDLGCHYSAGKLARFFRKGTQVDLYLATPQTWATLLLIRTGSARNNIRLCSLARAKGLKLHANGDGLFNEKGERVAGDSEEAIYAALELKYQLPWDRE